MSLFNDKVAKLPSEYEALLIRRNEPTEEGNGVITRYRYPVLTATHTPVLWRYDLNEETSSFLMERISVNVTLSVGVIKWEGKYLMLVRIEGVDHKSFFTVAESPNGIDNFRFWEYPVTLPEDVIPATNVYDMCPTAHEDSWIYDIFCAERHDDDVPTGDLLSATATAGIARTRDLKNQERLPGLKTKSQQHSVVLHPEFIDGKYASYIRPQNGFTDTGSGGGIGRALIDDMTRAEVSEEKITDKRYYHTVKEMKNGEGPRPVKTPQGWFHLAYEIRNCAAGLRYVLHMYMTSLEDPIRLIASPGGYFMVLVGRKHIDDVSSILSSNGWIADDDGKVFIYYASPGTRMHVATSTIERLVDYCLHTPQDGFCPSASMEVLKNLTEQNLKLMK